MTRRRAAEHGGNPAPARQLVRDIATSLAIEVAARNQTDSHSAPELAVVWARSFAGLVLAFVVGGLREIGEPARKALIIDLAVPSLRARTVGLYYLVRSLAIAPGAFVGGLLWRSSPALPFFVAGAIGLLGVVVFVQTVDAEHAS